MELLCLDTNVLIWGIKGECSPGQEEMIDKAKVYIQWIDANGVKVIIPSVVVSELLVPVPGEAHGEIIEALSENFMMADFDMAAASKCALVWKANKDRKTIDNMIAAKTASRQEIKFDCQIIGIAVSQKSTAIISHDGNLAKLAEGIIPVHEIPTIPTQLALSLPEPERQNGIAE